MRIDSTLFGFVIVLNNLLSICVIISSQNSNSSKKYVVATNEPSILLTGNRNSFESTGIYIKYFKNLLKFVNLIFKMVGLLVLGLLALGSVIMAAETIR